MCTVLLSPGVNPIAVNKYIIQSTHEGGKVIPRHKPSPPTPPIGNIPATHFCQILSLPPGPYRGRKGQCTRKMKKDTNGNRTPSLPTCSTVRQPTAHTECPDFWYVVHSCNCDRKLTITSQQTFIGGPNFDPATLFRP